MDDMLNQLEALIQSRKQHPVEGSYTSHLFAEGRGKIAQKVGEEAVEVIVAALGQGQALNRSMNWLTCSIMSWR